MRLSTLAARAARSAPHLQTSTAAIAVHSRPPTTSRQADPGGFASESPHERRRPLRRGDLLKLLLLACTLLVAFCLCQQALSPPAPKARSSPPAELAAQRAAETLDLMLGDGAPHPVGSERNRRVRDRLLGELTRLSYQPKVHHAQSCNAGVCAEVDNLFVHIPGSDPSLKSLLISAHYDSVPAAPGAADDGLGVASLLELARALKHRPPLRRDSVLLFTDGEEPGLLGMYAFQHHPAYAAVALCINLESRGNAGPSLLFETGWGDVDLVRRFSAATDHVVTSSMFQAVYEQMPTDTDFSVVRQSGRGGLNFATIAGIERYHTAQDDLQHLDRGTLQHTLDNLLGATTALAGDAATDQRAPAAERAAASGGQYFDLVGGGVIFLPPWFGYVALLTACCLLLIIAAWQHKRLAWGRLGWGLASVFAGLGASVAMAVALGWGLRRVGRLPDLWVAHPRPILAACAGISAATLLFQARRRPTPSSARQREPATIDLELGVAVGLVFCALGLGLQRQLPGAAYLAFIPALLIATYCLAAALEDRLAARRRGMAWLVWGWGCAVVFCVAILWLPIVLQLYAALGFLSLGIFSAAGYLLGLTSLPLISAKITGGARWAAAGTLGCVGFALLQPAYNVDVPQRASVGVAYDVDTKQSLLLVDTSHGPAPAALTQQFSLSSAPRPSFPWFGGWRNSSVVGSAEWTSRPRSSLKVARRSRTDAGTRLSLDWRREVWTEAVSFSLPVEQPVRVNFISGTLRQEDVPPSVVLAPTGPDQAQRRNRWVYLGNSKQLLRVELLVPSDPPAGALAVQVCEHRFELPTEIQKLVKQKRPDSATASQHGDNTVICRVEQL